jgi:hypothetical protein
MAEWRARKGSRHRPIQRDPCGFLIIQAIGVKVGGQARLRPCQYSLNALPFDVIGIDRKLHGDVPLPVFDFFLEPSNRFISRAGAANAHKSFGFGEKLTRQASFKREAKNAFPTFLPSGGLFVIGEVEFLSLGQHNVGSLSLLLGGRG